jgi:hypothetical protein
VETEPRFLKISDAPAANTLEAKQIYADIFRAPISSSYPHSLDRDQMEQLYPAGEEAARRCLDEFINHKVKDYHIIRDELKEPGCSALDPYVSNGIISIRLCVTAARAANGNKIFVGNAGIRAWIKDIAWKVQTQQRLLGMFPTPYHLTLTTESMHLRLRNFTRVLHLRFPKCAKTSRSRRLLKASGGATMSTSSPCGARGKPDTPLLMLVC